MPRLTPEQLSSSQQTILSCAGDYPADFSRSVLAKLLVGSGSVRVTEFAHNPYYGRLRDHGRKEITFEIDILLQQGYLELDQNSRLILANLPSVN